MKIKINVNDRKEPLGDLFGIFFEDINHAADGGLYAEMVRNKKFEFSPLDNRDYRSLTAWEKLKGTGGIDWSIQTNNPVSTKNPHYLVLEVAKAGEKTGVRNLGFNTGFCLEEGKSYAFSCYIRRTGGVDKAIRAALTDAAGNELCGDDIFAGEEWARHELMLTSPITDNCCRLALFVEGTGRVEVDFVSLFPMQTFNGKVKGLRKDIAELLAELKPKFMRFPGGCLVHDGTLNSDDRDSMYRWKNTVGERIQRPARRNNWHYHQTNELGYFEMFQFCEDIGAKPIPILPAGYNPHSGQSAPLGEMQEWIDDALDLIEFANGAPETKWGAVRAAMGHTQPFGMEYLGIGNEEVGDAFFERYAIIHNAVKEKYPEIKLINSAGPWCAGYAYDVGWKSARENGSDLIDEHFYQDPDWFVANHHRYDNFNEKTKVFLGEYGSWGSSWRNCLAEASFMIGLEKNAKNVALACYAPLLCNVDYINWRPDLIYYNNHQAYGTANYYVQKMFMNHQGEYRLDCAAEEAGEPILMDDPLRFTGQICVEPYRSRTFFQNIKVTNLDTQDVVGVENFTSARDTKQNIANVNWQNYSITFNSRQFGAGWGFNILFGYRDDKNYYGVYVGNWQNADIFISGRKNGAGTTYSQRPFSIEADRDYAVEFKVMGNMVALYLDGEKMIEYTFAIGYKEPVYYTASRDANGDVIVKLVNLLTEAQNVVVEFDGIENGEGELYAMEGYDLSDANSLEKPDYIKPCETTVSVCSGRLEIELPAESFRVYRIRS